MINARQLSAPPCATDTETLLNEIVQTVPPGRSALPAAARARLTRMTADLLAVRPDSVAEATRYLRVRGRRFPLPDAPVAAALAGRTVLVTGGSGCVGTALLADLVRLRPGRLINVDLVAPPRRTPGVEHLRLDLRERRAVDDCFARHRPDVVFHLAAQRDPGLAERLVADTLGTNLAGTVNVITAAERSGADRLIFASTGKAVRMHSTDVYAGSKRLCEWLVGAAAARGRLACSAVRFTHVVDNAIILERLRRWCAERGVIRLHSAATLFYVQSAAEAAQLLLAAATDPEPDGPRVTVLRDLDWPVHLLDLALGVMALAGTVTPIYLAGHDPGYAAQAYPGLYDPATAGDVSPLINAVEAGALVTSPYPELDAFRLDPVPAPQVAALLPDLLAHGLRGDDVAARQVFEQVTWLLLAATARATPQQAVRRMVRLAEGHRPTMTGSHRRVDDVLRASLAPTDDAGATRAAQAPA